MVKNFSLPQGQTAERHLQDKKIDVLQGLQHVGDKGSIAHEQQVRDQSLMSNIVGLEAPQIEEVVIPTVPNTHLILVLQIISCLFEHHAEEDAEESRCQNTTLHHSVGNGKGVRQANIECNLAAMVSCWWIIICRKLGDNQVVSQQPIILPCSTESKVLVRSTKVT